MAGADRALVACIACVEEPAAKLPWNQDAEVAFVRMYALPGFLGWM